MSRLPNERPLRSSGSSRADSFGQQHNPGGVGEGACGGSGDGTQKIATDDYVLTYLKEVREILGQQSEEYKMFIDAMKDFRGQRIDIVGVIASVKELFKGHDNLIYGFNTFLPNGCKMDEEETLLRSKPEFKKAMSFIDKIKQRFHNDDQVYKSFLDILNMSWKEHRDITDIYYKVRALFKDHCDLLEEFERFLPDTSGTALATDASFRWHSFRCDERSSALLTLEQTHMGKQCLRLDKIFSTHNECDHNVECPDIYGDKTMIRMRKEKRKHAERESQDRRNCDQDYREPDKENNGDTNVHCLPDKKKSAQQVEDVRRSRSFASFDDKDALKSMYSQEFTFCKKVKERLCSADDYQIFLKSLRNYATEVITRKELQILVADLLGRYPDLMEEFNKFLEHCERMDGFLAGVICEKSLWNEGKVSKSVKMEDKGKKQKHEMDGAKEKDRFKDKYGGKSIQDLNLSNCQCCTPSYRLLPEDYPIPSASQRSELDSQVLNDHWVSVTLGTEDYSFKHMRRNQYEESLIRCEDDRFELDMLLESVSSTVKRAEELLTRINDNLVISNGPICLEDFFTVLNLRCIERVYGDHGLDVMDILCKKPSLALPFVLARLKQKQEEWTKCQLDFNEIWAKIYAKNHHKSLDHCIFYFKQQDSNNLST